MHSFLRIELRIPISKFLNRLIQSPWFYTVNLTNGQEPYIFKSSNLQIFKLQKKHPPISDECFYDK